MKQQVIIQGNHFNRHEFSGVVVIYYLWWAMQSQDRAWWCAEKDGDIVDYHKKDVLIKNAEANGEKFAVLRYHKKGGGFTVMQKNY